MKVEFLKYKHHLIFLSALLIANFIVEPLIELQEELLVSNALLEKKQLKTASLLNNQESLGEINKKLTVSLNKANRYLFSHTTLSEFKLSAQSKVESLLTESNCKIERIGFKGNKQLLPELQKWYLEVQYQGDANCLIKATRAIESAQPSFVIEEYSYRANDFDKKIKTGLNARLTISVLFTTSKEAL